MALPASSRSPAAFERALEENFAVLYRMARTLATDEDEVEDLVQDASLRAMRAFPRLEHRDNLRSWFARVVHTTFLDRRRYEKRRPAEALDEAMDEVERHTASVSPWEPRVLSEGFDDVVAAALAELSPEARAVVQLTDVEGFTYQEVADALEIPVGTVRSRLFRARGALQKALSSMAPGTAAENET